MLGRFLSPDPYIQDPTNSQNYNRYSYCLNDPLKYTDVSGERSYYYDYFLDEYTDEYGNFAFWHDVQSWINWNCGYTFFDVSNGGYDDYALLRRSGGSSVLYGAIGGNIDGFVAQGDCIRNINVTNNGWAGMTLSLSVRQYEFGGSGITDWLNNTKTTLDIGGYAFSGLEKMAIPDYKNYFLGKNGKYYNKHPNGITGSRLGAIKGAKWYKAGGVATTILVGGVEVVDGVYQDGWEYGYNAKKATASAIGGGLGGWATAAICKRWCGNWYSFLSRVRNGNWCGSRRNRRRHFR